MGGYLARLVRRAVSRFRIHRGTPGTYALRFKPWLRLWASEYFHGLFARFRRQGLIK